MNTRARLFRMLPLPVLALISACSGSTLEFGRGYVLTHDDQHLTVAVTRVSPDSCVIAIVDCDFILRSHSLVVRNDGTKPFSLLAIVEHGSEVALSGELIPHLWVRFSELPSPASAASQDKVASTTEADFNTVERPKHYTSKRSYLAVELGAEQERVFELGVLRSRAGTESIKLHLDWK
jgi:hypothetical protein